jgi:alpha-beta hydrolase superfamily lysophospholipase
MERFYIKSKYDDLTIAVGIVRPAGEPKAVLQLVHGMCGNKERFEPVMEYLASQGIACIASDHRGHGESIRDRGDLGYFYTGGYKAIVQDMRDVSLWGMSQFRGIPYFLLGHSIPPIISATILSLSPRQINRLGRLFGHKFHLFC